MNSKSYQEFLSILGSYWLVEARDHESAQLLLQYIKNPKSHISEKEFQDHITDAIINKKFSISEYEKITGFDGECDEDVASDLQELWNLMYPNIEIKFPNI